MDVTTYDHTVFSPCCPTNGQPSSATLGDALPVCQTPQLRQPYLHGRDFLLKCMGGCGVIISHREIPSQR
jgi:hypothetical protein